MTWLICLVTLAYFVMGTLWLVDIAVPFEAFLWGGLILILGWWAHDAIRERQEGVVA